MKQKWSSEGALSWSLHLHANKCKYVCHCQAGSHKLMSSIMVHCFQLYVIKVILSHKSCLMSIAIVLRGKQMITLSLSLQESEQETSGH